MVNRLKKILLGLGTALTMAAAGAAAAQVQAQVQAHPQSHPQSHPSGRPPPFVQPAHRPPPFHAPAQLDQHYRHDHYYPSHGAVFPALPAGSIRVVHGGGQWYFHAGVFLRPQGAHFVVAAPPHGIVVPVLPPAYVPLWIAGVPYYYANGIYYAAAPSGYAVVTPPVGVQGVQPVPVAPSFIIYPQNGQSSEQAEVDRAACNEWAAMQAGAAADYAVFRRSFEACMDARGYTVR